MLSIQRTWIEFLKRPFRVLGLLRFLDVSAKHFQHSKDSNISLFMFWKQLTLFISTINSIAFRDNSHIHSMFVDGRQGGTPDFCSTCYSFHICPRKTQMRPLHGRKRYSHPKWVLIPSPSFCPCCLFWKGSRFLKDKLTTNLKAKWWALSKSIYRVARAVYRYFFK